MTTTTEFNEADLPELPSPEYEHVFPSGGYSRTQMDAYALAAVAASRKKLMEQKPVYQIAKATGSTATAWIDVDEATVNSAALHPDDFRIRALYAAPIATPEHDANVRDAALEEAAKVCMTYSAERAELYGYGERSTEAEICADRIRDLKSSGADHAK